MMHLKKKMQVPAEDLSQKLQKEEDRIPDRFQETATELVSQVQKRPPQIYKTSPYPKKIKQ